MAAKYLDVLGCLGVVEQGIGESRIKAQALASYNFHTKFALVEAFGILKHQLMQFRRFIKTTAIRYPPVGFVLQSHGIYIHPVVGHICKERVEPRKKVLIVLRLKFATLTACSSVLIGHLPTARAIVMAGGDHGVPNTMAPSSLARFVTGRYPCQS